MTDARMLQVEMEVLLGGEAAGLVSLLQREQLSVTALNRLDQLTTRNLRSRATNKVMVVFRSLEIISRRREDLEVLISRGLSAKLLHWFDVLHDLLTFNLRRPSAALLTVAEAFFDYFLVLAGGSLPASHLSVLLVQLAQFCQDQELHFPLRLDAVRTLNSILEALDQDQRRNLRSGQNYNRTLCEMAAAVLTAGDYELQASLSEALCRLTPRRERHLRANQWFPCCDISDAFTGIRDQEFEVDCRRFLNVLNSWDGHQSRVSSFPCRRAFLEDTELFPPQDDQLEQFWVDFNLGSGCVSFFINDPEGFLWASVHLVREEVAHCSVRHSQEGCHGQEVVLSVQVKTPIMHQGGSGQRVELTFDLEIQAAVKEATSRVFQLDPDELDFFQQGPSRVEASPPPFVPLPMCQQTRRSPSPRKAAVLPRNFLSRKRVKVYRRRRRKLGSSNLKVLPLSSPSSDDDGSVIKESCSDYMFDRLCHMTSIHNQGPVVGAEPDLAVKKSGSSTSDLLQSSL